MNYSWASATSVGHVRETNEDSVFPKADGQGPGPTVIAIADGMGGAVAGEVASRLAIEAATTADDGLGARARVAGGNRAVVEATARDAALYGMGTTLTLGIFHPDGTLELAHVGDSRAYLWRGGHLDQITTDHTVVAEMVARGSITAAEAEVHHSRHLLTRVIGMPDIAIDDHELALRAGDRIMLCSDGLTGMVSDDRIADLLGNAADASEGAWSLVEAANAAGGLDNTTVAVVDVAP